MSDVPDEEALATGKAILELRQSSIYIIWHDSYCEWQVVSDSHKRVEEDCRFEGWGATIPEAIANRRSRASSS